MSVDAEHLSALWWRRWPKGPPVAHELRTAYTDRWVRFHSLPGSKRYAETEEEYAVVLDRYNTVLDELFAGEDVYVVTVGWSWESDGPEVPERRREVHGEGTRWLTLAHDDESDPEFHSYTHLYADRRPWQRGAIDGIFREAADDVLAGVFVSDLGVRRIHHPYDGGADVILATSEERDRLRARHTDWLSGHPSGQ
ncbi:hypothetical protein AB0L99_26680 [Streptomyces sp. NPDC051954]|uniref:DUF3885 domain-containing protein n=1 Tax=unclassified Streptomyces TaxID=2593676 RepID=UPI0034307A0F